MVINSLPQSPIGMLQEEMWPDVWKILVVSILHNQTSRKQVDKVYEDLFKKYPNAFRTDNPKIILEAIDHWKKYRRF